MSSELHASSSRIISTFCDALLADLAHRLCCCSETRPYRAQEHFKEALDIYASYLGPSNSLVSDLENRIQEVQSYVDE